MIDQFKVFAKEVLQIDDAVLSSFNEDAPDEFFNAAKSKIAERNIKQSEAHKEALKNQYQRGKKDIGTLYQKAIREKFSIEAPDLEGEDLVNFVSEDIQKRYASNGDIELKKAIEAASKEREQIVLAQAQKIKEQLNPYIERVATLEKELKRKDNVYAAKGLVMSMQDKFVIPTTESARTHLFDSLFNMIAEIDYKEGDNGVRFIIDNEGKPKVDTYGGVVLYDKHLETLMGKHFEPKQSNGTSTVVNPTNNGTTTQQPSGGANAKFTAPKSQKEFEDMHYSLKGDREKQTQYYKEYSGAFA